MMPSNLSIFVIVMTLATTTMAAEIGNSSEPYTVEVISKENFDLGEGPHWRDGTLFFIDAVVGDLHRFSFDQQGKVREEAKINLGDLTSVIIPVEGSQGQLTLATIRSKLVKVDWRTKKHEVIAEVAKERAGKERFNDGKIDARGRLWIGTVLNDDKGVVPGGGSLYKLVGSELVKMSDNFTLSNGMAWTKNNSIMYFNDSEGQKIYKFSFHLENGTVSNKEVLIDVATDNQFTSAEYPDGMAIDNDDYIWAALWGGGRIVRIDPITRKVVASVATHAPFTTSIAFGGARLDELYVTSASVEYTAQQKEKYPNAGKLFRVRVKEGSGTKLDGPEARELKL